MGRPFADPKKSSVITLTANEVLDLDIPDIKHMAEGLFEEGALIYLVGTPGSSKSLFMMFVSLCFAEKDEILTTFKVNKPYKTLWIDEENGLRRTKHKLRRLMATMDVKTDKVIFSSMNGFRINQNCVDDLEKVIKKEEPNIIVLDSFVRVFGGDERDEKEVKKVHTLLKPLIDKYNISIFLLHHLRKENLKWKSVRTLDDIRGSGDLGGQCDQAFLLRRDGNANMKDFTKKFACVPLKEKDGIEGDGFDFFVKGDPKGDELRLLWGGFIKDNIDEAYEKTREDIIKYITDNSETCLNELNKNLNHSKSTISKVLKQLIEDDVLVKTRNGRRIIYTFANGFLPKKPFPTGGK